MKLSKVDVTSENKEIYLGNPEIRKIEFNDDAVIKSIEMSFRPPGYYNDYSYTIHFINNEAVKDTLLLQFSEKNKYWIFYVARNHIYTKIDLNNHETSDEYKSFLSDHNLTNEDFKSFILNFSTIDEAFQEDRPKFL